MEISTAIFPGAALPAQPAPFSAPLRALILTAAGIVQRWRGQTRQACQLGRAWRAKKALEAKRQERDRQPLASRGRSAARFDVLSLEHTVLALEAFAAGDVDHGVNLQAEAAWFAAQARRLDTA